MKGKGETRIKKKGSGFYQNSLCPCMKQLNNKKHFNNSIKYITNTFGIYEGDDRNRIQSLCDFKRFYSPIIVLLCSLVLSVPECEVTCKSTFNHK